MKAIPSSDRQPLTREAVLDAAIRLVDAEGAQALTMRRLAGVLGVEAMSLYNHVENKQDILDGMAGLLISRMRPWDVIAGDGWQGALRSVCRAYRETIVAHPHVFVGQAGRALVASEDRSAFEQLMRLLGEAGFDDETASDLFQAGANLTRGFAFADIAHAGAAGPVSAWDRGRAFERALDVIIGGFGVLRHGSP